MKRRPEEPFRARCVTVVSLLRLDFYGQFECVYIGFHFELYVVDTEEYFLIGRFHVEFEVCQACVQLRASFRSGDFGVDYIA